MAPRRKKVYEGKAKILYEGTEPGTLVQYFKDDATAFNAEKTGQRRHLFRPKAGGPRRNPQTAPEDARSTPHPASEVGHNGSPR